MVPEAKVAIQRGSFTEPAPPPRFSLFALPPHWNASRSCPVSSPGPRSLVWPSEFECHCSLVTHPQRDAGHSLQTCGPVSLCESSSHTASLGGMGQVGSDRNSAMQCIKGFFADDKTMAGRTYNLLLCPCTCMLLWDSRGPQHQCDIWNQHTGQRPPERAICLKGLYLPAGCPWSSWAGREAEHSRS